MKSQGAETSGSFVVWLTGLSGAGKSTLAHELRARLLTSGKPSVVLDGDRVRSGLCSDLGFEPQDRRENVRRVAELAKLILESGQIAIVALISPTRDDRQWARRIIGAPHFVEVYCQCPLEICESRDVKGLYRLARSGGIGQFTGISAPYEPPLEPEVVLNTGVSGISECAGKLLTFIRTRYG
ncbi:adenylyl-sulfate kinase [Variovorax sp. DXTD-1]|uniref:adenylyl-sulfate kinase n=1 Tax=Variovorax sp. DXTD-1 TaxID=2495592 RepID=UPI000F8760CD|nr:adenylyl-sulfate kinase [Variovorax sp. DXTD-1]RST48053.1 adenylyl-sulfate kinase [Variovorax sp. DXTD-1]